MSFLIHCSIFPCGACLVYPINFRLLLIHYLLNYLVPSLCDGLFSFCRLVVLCSCLCLLWLLDYLSWVVWNTIITGLRKMMSILQTFSV